MKTGSMGGRKKGCGCQPDMERQSHKTRTRGAPNYIEGENKAQRGTVTCPKSHSDVLLSLSQVFPCIRAGELTAGPCGSPQ